MYRRRMLTLHMVRHGDTPQSAEGVLCGDLDPPLTDSGKQQAQRVAEYAATLKIDAMYVSPMLRARMTMEPIAKACGRESSVQVRDGLREISYGAWEGRKETEVEEHDAALFAAWRADPGFTSPPGGESAFAIAARALPVIREISTRFAVGTVLVVSHKATIRVLTCALLGLPVGRFRDRIACPTASMTSFELHERGPMIVRVGDTHYLR